MKKLLVLAAITMMLGGCARGGHQPTMEELQAKTFSQCPSDYESMMKKYIHAKLFDPYSADIRIGSLEKWYGDGIYGESFLVSVNAKNRLGGYVGTHSYRFMCDPARRQIHQISNSDSYDYLFGFQY